MTKDQLAKLHAMAEEARPQTIFPDGNRERDGGDDWGSDRQIEAENAFHIFASDDLGIDTEDMATAKATCDDMINETLRRAEMAFLCDDLKSFCAAQGLPLMSADELLCELQAVRDGESSNFVKTASPDIAAQCAWLSDFSARWEAWEAWKEWQPRP